MSDSDPIPDPAPIPPATNDLGLPRNVAGGIACSFSIVSGVVFLVIERRDPFVRFWAMQSVLWGAVAIAASAAFVVGGAVLALLPIIGWLLGLILGLTYIVFQVVWVAVFIVCIVQAFCDREWEIPWVGKLARRQLVRLAASQPPLA